MQTKLKYDIKILVNIKMAKKNGKERKKKKTKVLK